MIEKSFYKLIFLVNNEINEEKFNKKKIEKK